MRKFNIVSLTLVLAVILAGCGRMASDPEAASPDSTGSAQPPFSGSKLSNLLGAKPSELAITIPAGMVIASSLGFAPSRFESLEPENGGCADPVLSGDAASGSLAIRPQPARMTARTNVRETMLNFRMWCLSYQH